MLMFRKVSVARIDLHNLVNAAYYQGQVTIITIGKAEKAAIVPLSMVDRDAAMAGTHHPNALGVAADIKALAVPRNEVPPEVTAHSQPAAQGDNDEDDFILAPWEDDANGGDT